MGYELLELVTGILTAAGIRAGEEFPAGKRMEILMPAAAVGLLGVDAAAGEARFTVRILSPRMLGGWCCQVCAAKAGNVLEEAGLTVQTARMEYDGGADCYCIVMTAVLAVVKQDGSWQAGKRWQVFCGEAELTGVVSFRSVRHQGRRLVGTFCQSAAVAITPGAGGWELELVRWVSGAPEAVEEPFNLTVRDLDREFQYRGCCWNETVLDHTQGGLRMTKRGFALEREVVENG